MILISNTKFYLETRDRVAAFSFLEGREVVLPGDAREEGAHHAGEGGPPLSEHLGLGDLSEGPVPGLLADVSGDLGEVAVVPGPAGWPGLLSKINFLLSLSFRFSYLRYVRPRISLKYHSSGSNG